MAEAARAEEGPVPASEGAAHSGRLLLRMPQSLHGELARAAEQEGVSLNAFITGVLASAVAWRAPDAPTDADPAAGRPGQASGAGPRRGSRGWCARP